MRLTSEDVHHRSFLLAVLAAASVAFPLLFETAAVLLEPHIEWHEMVPMTLPFAGGTATSLLAIVVLGGGLYGWIVSWQWKRPLIMAAVRAACYASPMLLLAVVLFCLNMLALIHFAPMIKRTFGPNAEVVAGVLVFGPPVPALLWFIWMNYRVAMGARHARE